jgi:hypothetical protein
MRYTAIFEISPTGLFGLPEGTRTILPTDAEYQSDFYIHSQADPRPRKVAWGSLSIYRSPEAKLDEPLDFGEVKGRITDNYASLMVEADNADEAKGKLITSIDRLLQQLALKFSVPLSYRGVVMEDETGKRYPIRTETMPIIGLRTYNLDELRDEVRQVQAYVGLNDDRLDRALTYFEHAVWLFEQQSQQGDFRSRHASQVASSIFLNSWKAITTIVGDPNEGDYQSRYRKLGLDYNFFKNGIDKITKMRNTLDIAHHHLDATVVEQVEEAMGEALGVAREVIARYRDSIKAG